MKVALALAVSSIFLAGLQAQKAKTIASERPQLFGLETPIKNPANLPEDVLVMLRTCDEVRATGCLDTEDYKFSENWFEAARVRLNHSKHLGLLVKAKNGCLFGANIGPFWIFERTSTGHKLILSVSAVGVNIVPSYTNGYRDVRASAVAGGKAVSVTFTFDGQKYVLKH